MRAVWLYLRFTLSYRDVEDLLAERGLMVSNESIRRWVLKFGPIIAKNLRAIRPKPHSRWHLDEMMVGERLPARLAGGRSHIRASKSRALADVRQCWIACAVHNKSIRMLSGDRGRPVLPDAREDRSLKLGFFILFAGQENSPFRSSTCEESATR
jgi:hypothetical protein